MANQIVTLLDFEEENNLLPRTKLKAISGNDGLYLSNQLNAEDINQLQGKTVLTVENQTLTDAEKAQVRAKINAAAPDGYYGESGGVFQYATNFLGKNTPQNASNLYFRPTASNYSGSGWSADSISGKTATIQKIKGKLLMFNQLLNKASFPSTRTINGVTFTNNGDGSITVNGTATADASYEVFNNLDAVGGHKYLQKGCPAGGSYDTYYFNTQLGADLGGGIIVTKSSSSSGNIGYITVRNGVTVNNKKFYPQIHDLTQMYGAGKEPQTVGEFKAQFPLDYYQYTQATPLPFMGTGLKTVGFNQWDEVWELGSYNRQTGGKVPATDRIRCKNLIPVLPNTTYYFYVGGSYSNKGHDRIYYDAEGNFIEGINSGSNLTFTTPANCYYVAFSLFSTYGTTYNHDVCINLSWSGIRDGEYEPYWNSTLSLPIATYFPDGMCSAGTAYDELTKDKATKRIGRVKCKDLTWSKVSSVQNIYRADYADKKSGVDNIRCNLYDNTSVTSWDDSKPNHSICGSPSSGAIIIKDNTYTDVTAFTNHFTDSDYVYFELDEPVETTISPALNLTFTCDDFGTEMQLPQNTSTELLSAPGDYEIVYQLDYEADVRNMGQNMISKESMDGFISAFNSSGLGTIVQTWDSTNKKYTYTVTPPAEPEPSEE